MTDQLIVIRGYKKQTSRQDGNDNSHIVLQDFLII
jgi:hypothetical protein